MPARSVVTEELARLFNILSHPHRIRIVEELRDRECDVNTLQDILGISHSRVSQHLAKLRSHRLVTERREGRHVFYRLLQPQLARWLLDGLQFLEGRYERADAIREAVDEVRTLWLDGDEDSTPGDTLS